MRLRPVSQWYLCNDSISLGQQGGNEHFGWSGRAAIMQRGRLVTQASALQKSFQE